MKFEYTINKTIGIISIIHSSKNKTPSPLFADLTELSQFLETPALKGVIIQGKEQHFYNNKNRINMINNKGKDTEESLNQYKKIVHKISYSTIPVAAMIQGDCFDIGIPIALACHFQFASDTARFVISESNQNFITSLINTILNKDDYRKKDITQFTNSGKIISCMEAENIGLIDETASSSTIETITNNFLTSLIEKRSSNLIRKILQSIHNINRMPKKEALYQESVLFDELVKDTISQTEAMD